MVVAKHNPANGRNIWFHGWAEFGIAKLSHQSAKKTIEPKGFAAISRWSRQRTTGKKWSRLQPACSC